jgi:hypothetical protein
MKYAKRMFAIVVTMMPIWHRPSQVAAKSWSRTRPSVWGGKTPYKTRASSAKK